MFGFIRSGLVIAAAAAAAVWINTDSIKLMLLYSSIVERVTGLAAAIGSAVRASLILCETTAAAANAQAAGNNDPTSSCVYKSAATNPLVYCWMCCH